MSLNHIRTSKNGYAFPRTFTGKIACDYIGSNVSNFTATRGQDGSMIIVIEDALTAVLTASTPILNLNISQIDEDFKSSLTKEQIVPINIGGPTVNTMGGLYISPTTGLPYKIINDANAVFPAGTYQVTTSKATFRVVNSV